MLKVDNIILLWTSVIPNRHIYFNLPLTFSISNAMFNFVFFFCHLCFHLKVGVGMCMEGIEQNPVVYDLMSEMAFQHNKVDVKVHVLCIIHVPHLES